MSTTGGDSLPLPTGPSARPGVLSMANGLKKRFSRGLETQPQPPPPPPPQPSAAAAAAARNSPWCKIHLFRGMVNDLRRRAPYYWSDWKDACDYRVVPATIYIYFANILPALAFSLDMFTRTHSNYGVNEVLLSSVLGSVVFAVLACQPLVIVGVTGPITVFNYTVYDIIAPTGAPYLAFMAWVGLWALLLHWLLAATNSCNWLTHVTRFPCDVFGFYVACIYLQKGVQILVLLGDAAPFYLSTMAAVLVFAAAYACDALASSALFHRYVRQFFKDYGTPLTVLFFTGFVHLGRMKDVKVETLPTSTAFLPTVDRSWLVHFWDIRVADVFWAIPFALLLTILFWFDHNVSSLIAQGTEFPLRKPAGFHWDLFLLGLTTGVAGLLGLPFPNGLIPQAPFHTEALCVTKVVHAAAAADDDDEGAGGAATGAHKGRWALARTHVVEQRFSNLAQGLLTLGTMAGPLLGAVHLLPQGVLAGLFFTMGYRALAGNGITAKLRFLARDSRAPGGGGGDDQRHGAVARRGAVWAFVAVELAGFGATFAVTQTRAAVGFPCFILALVPVRALLLPRWFTPRELGILDGPAASPFTMESAGGGKVGGGGGEEGVDGNGDVTAAGGNTSPSGAAGSNGGGSQEELAELGENKGVRLSASLQHSGTRRRNSAVGREGAGEGDGDEDGDEDEDEDKDEERDAVERRGLGANRRRASKVG